MSNVKSPLNELPMTIEEILQEVDYCLVTHIHPDHFTKEYLPKDIPIIVQDGNDLQKAKSMGFENVIAFEGETMVIDDLKITKTLAKHGDNEELAARMGKVSGYIFSGEEKRLYIAADTIFYDGVESVLKAVSPEAFLNLELSYIIEKIVIL